MMRLVRSLLLVLASAGPAANVAGAGPSLCASSEEVVFSCPLARKVVSLCATRDLNSMVGSLVYRFGRLGQSPELIYPDLPAHPKTYFRGKSLLYSGGGGAFISFDRGAYTYTVFTAIGRGWGQKEGIVVDGAGRRRVYLPCRERASSVLGDDWFRGAGIPAASSDFELP